MIRGDDPVAHDQFVDAIRTAAQEAAAEQVRMVVERQEQYLRFAANAQGVRDYAERDRYQIMQAAVGQLAIDLRAQLPPTKTEGK